MAIPTIMTYVEADSFGIPYPLQNGWLKKHGHAEITDYMREKLMKSLAKKIGKKQKHNKPPSKYNQIGLDILHGKSGPVVISKPSTNRTVQTAPKKYKGSYIDPNSPEFLASYQWRTLRFDVIAKYGNACQYCGAVPNAKAGISINVDHIFPRKTHPHLALEMSNLQILCSVCNHGKSNRHVIDFRPEEDTQDMSEYSDETIGQKLRNF